MSSSSESKNETIGSRVLGIMGWGAGTAVGLYAGMSLLIPLCITALVWWAGSKHLKGPSKLILPVLAFNTGHFLWLALGLVLSGASALSSVGGDLLVYAIGLAWLLKKPSLGPLLFLGIFQFVSLGINSYYFVDATVGSAIHKALLIHLIWRAIALFLMVKLALTLQRSSQVDTDFSAQRSQ